MSAFLWCALLSASARKLAGSRPYTFTLRVLTSNGWNYGVGIAAASHFEATTPPAKLGADKWSWAFKTSGGTAAWMSCPGQATHGGTKTNFLDSKDEKAVRSLCGARRSVLCELSFDPRNRRLRLRTKREKHAGGDRQTPSNDFRFGVWSHWVTHGAAITGAGPYYFTVATSYHITFTAVSFGISPLD